MYFITIDVEGSILDIFDQTKDLVLRGTDTTPEGCRRVPAEAIEVSDADAAMLLSGMDYCCLRWDGTQIVHEPKTTRANKIGWIVRSTREAIINDAIESFSSWTDEEIDARIAQLGG